MSTTLSPITTMVPMVTPDPMAMSVPMTTMVPMATSVPTTPGVDDQVNQIVTNELNRITQKQQGINDVINTQKRLIGFNNSFNQRYSYYLSILYVVITALAIFIALSIIGNMFPIPSIIIDILVILLICGTFVIVYSYYAEMIRRDNMDFNELALNPPADTSLNINIAGATNLMPNLYGNLGAFGSCIGQSCCGEDTVWDSNALQCVYTQDIGNSVPNGSNGTNGTTTTNSPMSTTLASNSSVITGTFNTMSGSVSESFVGGVLPNSAYEFSDYTKI